MPKKNSNQDYTPDVQENRERIIRLESVMQRIEQRLDELSLGIKEILEKVERGDTSNRQSFATKSELEELKRSHRALSNRLLQVIMFVVFSILAGLFALIGIKP